MRLHVGLPLVASHLSLSGHRDVRFGTQTFKSRIIIVKLRYSREGILRPIEVAHTSTALVGRIDNDLKHGPRLHRFVFSVLSDRFCASQCRLESTRSLLEDSLPLG